MNIKIMEYHDYLLKVLKGECPFCDIDNMRIVEKGKHFTVILSRAPYVKDHLLIVPNRHLVRMGEIKPEEWETFIPLMEKWMKKLEKVHKEVNLLLRDGVANGVLGKSIDHLHFHLIPECPVYSAHSGGDRQIFSDFQLAKKTAELKIKYKGK